MAILTREQHDKGYFKVIGGFPPAKIIHTVPEFDGSERCCIACTQIPGISDREQRQILKDWIRFLTTNTTVFTALHFNSHVPQALFDAACCQENLTELRFKWGRYKDLSSLSKLQHLRFLYLGSCPGVTDLSPITELDQLTVLYLQNLKRIEDYSPLVKLPRLEQLVISGPILSDIHIQDLDFIPEMPSLASFRLINTVIRKRYSVEEQNRLRALAPHVQGIGDQQWWTL